jgi:hypothetical protein
MCSALIYLAAYRRLSKTGIGYARPSLRAISPEREALMAVSFSKFSGLAFGATLMATLLPVGSASALPLGGAAAMRTETALPMIDVQQRVTPRRPVRPVAQQRRKRNNDRALAAGALVGAAIIGGAIIANSQRQRQPQYYYGAPGYPPDYYRRPQPQPYYGGPVYYEQPGYYQPRPRVRPQPEYYYQPQPGYVYQEPRPRQPRVWQDVSPGPHIQPRQPRQPVEYVRPGRNQYGVPAARPVDSNN